MLGKLLKHEFRATARIMWPIFAALGGLAILGNLSGHLLDGSTRSMLLRIMGVLVLVAFGLAIAVVAVMSVVVMVSRFHHNLLTDEGYLMFTLPVNVHALVWAKIIVSVVWFLAAAAAVVLSLLIVSFRVNYVQEIVKEIQQVFSTQIPAEYSGHIAAFCAEAVVAVLLSGISLCLLFYAAMAMGYGFPKNKAGLSVLFFFVFQFAAQIIGTNISYLVGRSAFDTMNSFRTAQEVLTFAHGTMGYVIVCQLVYCGVFYLVTILNLKKRLNLE